MARHHALEAFALACALHINDIALFEHIHLDLLTKSEIVRIVYMVFTQTPFRGNARFFEMAFKRLCHEFLSDIAKANLYCIVTVRLGRLLLSDDARASLHNCNRNDSAVIEEQLRHT
jgi:hypothetical protein